MFPEATRFIDEDEADRFMLGSKLVKSWVDLNVCCSSQCFCIILPNSIDNCAEISNRIADKKSSPGRWRVSANDDVNVLHI